MLDIIVGRLKNKDPTINNRFAQLSEVVQQMRESRRSCVMIVEDGKPIGIFTERDLVRVVNDQFQSGESLSRPITDFMTHSPFAVNDATPLFEAIAITQNRKIRHLPIVDDDGRLTGVLSYNDLAKAYEHAIEQQRAQLEREVHERTLELQGMNEQLKALSLEDALLHIGNRRGMEVDLSYTHSVALRYKRPYSIVLFDIDFFKQYNDCYGHQAGDSALIEVSNGISDAIRKADRLYRYGGEELLLLLPETDIEGSTIVAERVVEALYKKAIPHERSLVDVLTVSGGVAGLREPFAAFKDWQSVVAAADKALYEAKKRGRNQIAVFDET